MVDVSYHCPYCGAVTAVERDGYLDDKCVTREPLDGWTYTDTTGDFEAADGIEFVCLGADAPAGSPGSERPTGTGGANDPDPDRDGCGRTFYLSFVRYDEGEERDHRVPDVDRPRFDFRP